MKGRSALPRTVFLAAMAIVAAFSSAVWWGPAVLRHVPWFQVRRVEVVGTAYVAPDEVLEAADIHEGRSVFDDFGDAEARIAEHPLIERARIVPRGPRSLRVEVQELVPIVLAPVPELRALTADGTILPLDPTRRPVDLPILAAPLQVREGRAVGGAGLELLRGFARLHALDPGLAAIVSDVRAAHGGGIALGLIDSREAEELLLPAHPDDGVVRRLRATLSDLRRRGWTGRRLEARYAGLVVVQRKPSARVE